MADARTYPAAPSDDSPKVLYLGGTGRTGSTLLTRVLGQIPGWFAGGELAFLWRHGIGQGGRCSCGRVLTACPIWGEVFAEVAAAGFRVDADRMVALRRRCWSVHLPLLASHRAGERLLDRLEEFPATVEAVYRAVAKVTGCRVLVDSSKEPHYSWILRERTGLDVYFLHLVRDPRAVGHSWRRRRRELGFAGDAQMQTRGPLEASVYYDVSNVAAEALWSGRPDRYRLARYEDFVARPLEVLHGITQFVTGADPPPALLTSGELTPAGEHIAWGNPNRFDTGAIRVRPDESWRRSLPPMAAFTLTAACWPVACRYGYPLRADHQRRAPRTARLRGSVVAAR